MRMRFMGPCRTRVIVAPEIVVGADRTHAEAWQALAEAVGGCTPFVITGDSLRTAAEAGGAVPSPTRR